MITIFGVPFGRKPLPPAPTPLEKATTLYTAAQFALLNAQGMAENANAEVALYSKRIERLRIAMRDLANDKTIENT